LLKQLVASKSIEEEDKISKKVLWMQRNFSLIWKWKICLMIRTCLKKRNYQFINLFSKLVRRMLCICRKKPKRSMMTLILRLMLNLKPCLMRMQIHLMKNLCNYLKSYMMPGKKSKICLMIPRKKWWNGWKSILVP
jgi:hypothetical protein